MQQLMSLAILLLTGLVFGRLMKLVKMPNVTGYLIGGLIVGPSVLNLVHADALSQLGFISSVALGFIAFSIGSEFKASYFKRVGHDADRHRDPGSDGGGRAGHCLADCLWL